MPPRLQLSAMNRSPVYSPTTPSSCGEIPQQAGRRAMDTYEGSRRPLISESTKDAIRFWGTGVVGAAMLGALGTLFYHTGPLVLITVMPSLIAYGIFVGMMSNL